ncbi:AraC family transcriptional regulator [Robertkochia marina]|uniref:AraC family transcriptional regulator n=1 Tax=Robertkochia marina TaxID=1227945 RepID=A0A4S3M308_9FLAO|nr:AraC family transcriptional regulator [Robertkochia marina]THD69069.1 AraC family transcriptional regulator [Robertkochia marina]TRZ44893.1 AraC family transcriptional regulator [Robertkochia marina]
MKVFPFKIPKPANENLVIQVDRERIFYDKLHQHEEIQVSYMVEGYGKLLVNDNVFSYHPGDLFILGGEMPHLFRSEPRGEEVSHMISFFLTEDAFGEEFFRKKELSSLMPFFRKSQQGLLLRADQHDLSAQFLRLPGQDQFARFMEVLNIMHALSGMQGEVLSSFRYNKGITDADGERLQVVFDQVIRNFRDPIALEEIAAMVHMTPNAFCRYFKTRTNKTFFEYLIAIRVEHACELLSAHPDLQVAEVAYACGFKTLSHFNKKFKELKGVSPRSYRLNVHSA